MKPKMSLAELQSFFGMMPIRPGMDYRNNKATNKGHIHTHKKTWLPKTRTALTHAWYRRHLQIPPSRRKEQE